MELTCQEQEFLRSLVRRKRALAIAYLHDMTLEEDAAPRNVLPEVGGVIAQLWRERGINPNAYDLSGQGWGKMRAPGLTTRRARSAYQQFGERAA